MTPPLRTVAIVGGGINGLVAANYLSRAGLEVTLLEKTTRMGGAAIADRATVKTVSYEFSPGASVMGMMQRFIFEETGLATHVPTYVPEHPAINTFADDHVFPDPTGPNDPHLKIWGERVGGAAVRAFYDDLEHVVSFLTNGFRAATAPSVEDAYAQLGSELTERWILGSARDALEAYLSSPELMVKFAASVSESGPVSIDSPRSAFTIPLMQSGTIFDGDWGYVKGGMGNLTETLATINAAIGVRLRRASTVLRIEGGRLTYTSDGKELSLEADAIFLATPPAAIATMIEDPTLHVALAQKKTYGTAGKLTYFFDKPLVWNDLHYGGSRDAFHDSDTSMRYHHAVDTLDKFERQNSGARHKRQGTYDFVPSVLQFYPEGHAARAFGTENENHVLSVYFTHLPTDKTGDQLNHIRETLNVLVQSKIHDPRPIGELLRTPADLQAIFGFTNIDHFEISDGQTFDQRTLSKNPRAFFQLGDHENIFFCGAGAYPCGSVAGTAGYMAAMQLLDAHNIPRPNGTASIVK